MKILFTTFTYYPETSGVSVAVQNLAEGLAQKGYDVSVATTNRGGHNARVEQYRGVSINRFEFTQNAIKGYSGEFRKYIKFVRSFEKDILILECVQCFTTDILLPYLKDLNCKIILHSHGGPGLSMKMFGYEGDLFHTIGHTFNFFWWRRYYRWILRRYARYVNCAICLSLCSSDLVYMNQCMKRVAIVENAANDIFFSEDYYTKDYTEVLQLKSKEYILCIANYIPNKGQLSIVEAFSQLKNPDCALVMIGSRKTPYHNKVESLANKVCESTGKEIVLLTGVDRTYFPSIISHAKLFVMASEHEEYPVSLVEAMACGTPFLSTDAGCSRILPGGVTVRERKDLPLYMSTMDSNADWRERLSNAGKEYATSVNTINAVVNEFENVILK